MSCPDVDDPEKFADPDCPGCQGGDKAPAWGYWRCPVCDAEWEDEDSDIEVIED
jgi:hypothetical protein